MKKLISLFISLAFAGSTFAQMSGYSTSQSNGTTLGANETLTADGIALGNAVKLRGYVDLRLQRHDSDDDAEDKTHTSADLDFLVDLSPVTAEIHLNASGLNADNGEDDVDLLEQAFGRYSFNQDFHLTFGRQVTSLGFDSDEATGRYAVSTAYMMSRKDYVDGLRVNYNNGMFGLVLGLHDHYGIFKSGARYLDAIPTNDDELDDGIAIDIAASVVFFPGLEARLGYANENGGKSAPLLDENGVQVIDLGNGDDDSHQINGWLAWNPGDLTLAIEFDNFQYSDVYEAWDLMLMANYQFSEFIAATLRYSHLDLEVKNVGDAEFDRITLALLFSITENFDLNVEYSHTSADDDDDLNEFYLQGLIHF